MYKRIINFDADTYGDGISGGAEKISPPLSTKNYKHLRFNLMSAFNVGENRHAQEVMKELGITYKLAVPQSLSDQWWFFNCENVPEKLPEYLEVADWNPMELIGYGLSKEEAEMLCPPPLSVEKEENHPMRISQFLDSYIITEEHVAKHFNLVKEMQIDAINHKGCLNCNDKHNNYGYRTKAWCGLYHCTACNSLMVIHYQDRMGGTHTDVVRVYQEKTKE